MASKLISREKRRSSNSIYRLRCIERPEIGNSLEHPVKLVIFDFDETLTLVTLMTPDGTYLPEQREWAREVNFETPWVAGSRVEKLHTMLTSLERGKHREVRVLACLTRNGNSSGVAAVINLMKAADLDVHFACVWALPQRSDRKCGAYQEDGKWSFFDPPTQTGSDHKADVIKQIVADPKAWFPQLGGSSQTSRLISRLSTLRLEQVVLVDDQRANFQSETGAQLLRYVKVARYDAEYRDFGLLKDMGGIGAHDDADYDSLKRFIEDPWMCKDTFMVRCQEREFPGNKARHPVSLVVFDFDETLTLATFMPEDKRFSNVIGETSVSGEWTKASLIEYNFETPWVEGSRVEKMQHMLQALIAPDDGVAAVQGCLPPKLLDWFRSTPAKYAKDMSKKRTLAVLTRHEHGVVAVYNMLKLAGLAEYFSAIWTFPARKSVPNGLYKEGKHWKSFSPPIDAVHAHKADVLHAVAQKPSDWFPQLKSPDGDSHCPGLDGLRLEGIVLVDDDRANFRSNSEGQAKVLRYCKVARYDENYRDCGALNQMGGIGAHSDADYETLKAFVERPWDYPYESAEANAAQPGLERFPTLTFPSGDREGAEALLRERTAVEEPEPPKMPRVRKSTRADLGSLLPVDIST